MILAISWKTFRAISRTGPPTRSTSRSAAESAEIALCTSMCASSPRGRRCCGLAVRVLRSVSWVVHSWSETPPFQGASTSHSPSSIALARTTSSSAVSRATLPISLRYIRTGSSIPIMSAERASSSSGVGSSSSFGSSLGGASAGSFSATISPLSPTTSIPISTARAGSMTATSSRSMSSSSSSSSSRSGLPTGESTATSARAGRFEASFASSCSTFVRRGRPARTASTSCLSIGSCATCASSYARPATAGRVSRCVCSILRSSDRRASLICRSSSSRRRISSASARRSASACSA